MCRLLPSNFKTPVTTAHIDRKKWRPVFETGAQSSSDWAVATFRRLAHHNNFQWRNVTTSIMHRLAWSHCWSFLKKKKRFWTLAARRPQLNLILKQTPKHQRTICLLELWLFFYLGICISLHYIIISYYVILHYMHYIAAGCRGCSNFNMLPQLLQEICAEFYIKFSA